MLEYKQVQPAGGNPDEQRANIGPGEFWVEAAGSVGAQDYREVNIHFGNGVEGDDVRFVPPPSPDWATSYGAL